MRNFASVICLVLIIPFAVHADVEKGIDVQKVQRILAELCYKPGPIDGAWGKKTEAAVIAAFKDINLQYDGYFDWKDENLVLRLSDASELEAKETCETLPNKITIFDNEFELPDNLDYQPNDATIAHYYKSNDRLRLRAHSAYKVKASSNPRQLSSALERHDVIDYEMATKTAFSYLYYEDGRIIYDAVPRLSRFNIDFNENSYFPSHSMGKSITSYLLGNAICQGYIESVDSEIFDWRLMKDTLYFGQPIINLLNMKAGDTHIIKEYDGAFIKTGRWFHGNAPLSTAVANPAELKGTKALPRPGFAYSNLAADILFNYVMHRTGSSFEDFIGAFYRDKIGIEYPVYLVMNPLSGRPNSPPMQQRIAHGAGQYGIFATRYDFLRIAIAMLEDWKSDTCEGKYLKHLFENRIKINKHKRVDNWNKKERRFGEPAFGNVTTSYAGQFWADAHGLRGKAILYMEGYNGQSIAIDMTNSRITVISAGKGNHVNIKKLAYEPLKYGRIR